MIFKITVLLLICQTRLGNPKSEADPWDWQNSRAEFPVYQTHQPNPSQTRNPEFMETVTNVTSRLGGVAQLPCTVKNLGQLYTVSWIRGRDTTVMSVGHHTFNTDNRFSIVQVPGVNPALMDWILQISNLIPEDQGVYECQVNTEPKIHKTVHLTLSESGESFAGRKSGEKFETFSAVPESESEFSEAEIQITGPTSQYASVGGNVYLECTLTSRNEKIPTILKWEKDGQELSARMRGGLSLETEKLPGLSRVKLYIESVKSADSGQYSCISDITKSSSIQLLITKGSLDKPSELMSGAGQLGFAAIMFCILLPNV